MVFLLGAIPCVHEAESSGQILHNKRGMRRVNLFHEFSHALLNDL